MMMPIECCWVGGGSSKYMRDVCIECLLLFQA